jgi:uncharacterized membrane protein YjjP (DUF1212 family)
MNEPNSAPEPLAPFSEPRQREVTRLSVETGVMLLQHGAESALVENLMRRLALALGVPRAEVALLANAVVLTTLSEGHCITTVRRNEDRGINMHVVTEVQRAVLDAEAGTLDAAGYRVRFEAVRPLRYPRWLTSVLIGLSCACFARLAGADWTSCGVALVAAGVAMAVRLQLARLHFNPMVNFFVTAFVATSVAGQGAIYQIGGAPRVAMASCVLLLVPGYPLINSISDMVKGYINTGLARGMYALLLSAGASAGILLAMSVWKVWAWL